MCGIAGILAPARANPNAVAEMTRVLAHRGPDGQGLWTSRDGACALGHRRLSILDLSSAGAQPMVDDKAGITVTYNGEIYNFIEVRDRLRAKGHAFRTGTDTEVLLRAYEEWGPDLLRELNGMFAFALWDEAKGELFCARDRFGEKPFHYAWIDGAFAFASEVKALATLSGVDLAIDAGVLAAHVEQGSTAMDASERTLVRGVRQLLPGHAIIVRRSGGRVSESRRWQYWDVPVDDRHGYGADGLKTSARRLYELLQDSVRLRLRSDVRVGSCLSGGLDSSTVVSLMRRLEPAMELRTFTGRFPGDPLDEGRYANMIVSASGTTHFETEPSAERFLRDAPKVYWHADFPIGGMSQFAQYCVFGLAREHDVTVLLDGQGSDEQLGGYGNAITRAFLKQLARERRVRALLHERKAAARAFPHLFSWSRLALNETPIRGLSPMLRRASGRSMLAATDLYRDGFLAYSRDEIPPIALQARGEDRSLSRTLWALSFRTMLSGLLRFGDRLSMAHSREVRLPFCDHRIAEFAFTVSPELLVGEGQVKRVLREAITELVPPAIVNRPKQGFVPPQQAWLVGPLTEWTRELAEDAGPIAEVMNMERVRQLVTAPERDRAREANALWHFANLAAWSRYALSDMRRLVRNSAVADGPDVVAGVA